MRITTTRTPTERELATYRQIVAHRREHGTEPTFAELRRALGEVHRESLVKRLRSMRKKGLLEYQETGSELVIRLREAGPLG